MKIYTHGYGPTAGKGIGTQCESAEIAGTILGGGILKDLSRLYTSYSENGTSEKLMYVLQSDKYNIIGSSCIAHQRVQQG